MLYVTFAHKLILNEDWELVESDEKWTGYGSTSEESYIACRDQIKMPLIDEQDFGEVQVGLRMARFENEGGCIRFRTFLQDFHKNS